MALDEHLRREIERAGQPADPSGVYEDLIRRRERRRLVRLTKTVGLSFAVLLGVAFGLLGLSRVFAPSSLQIGGGATNGRIAFANFEPEYAIPEVTAAWYVYTMEPDGSDVVFVGPRAVDEALYPTYSPDGRQIAFAGFTAEPEERALYVLDVVTGSLSKVFALDQRHQIDGLEWSPDGSRIGMLYTEQVPTEAPPEAGARDFESFSTIWTIAPDGSDMRPVTTAGRESDFSWSPDGTQIAFSRHEPIDPGEQFVANDIYLIDADGNLETRLTHDGRSMSPAWSPDGTFIAFESYEPDEVSGIDLWIMDADGTGRRRLTSDPGNEFGPTWSPDGTQIAYGERAIVNDGSDCFVSTIGSDGSNRERLFGMADEEGCPGGNGLSWAPVLQPQPETPTSPTPSAEPSESPTPETGPETDLDIGLGFPVCDVSSVEGIFAPGVTGTAFVATKRSADGGCPAMVEGDDVLAVDTSGDGLADVSYARVSCQTGTCEAFAAPDLHGDGIAEVAVAEFTNETGIHFRVYRVDDSTSTIERIGVPGGEGDGGDYFAWNDGQTPAGIECAMGHPGEPEIAAWSARSSNDGTWIVSQTVYRVDGSVLEAVSERDGVATTTLPDGGGSTMCGSRVRTTV